MSLSLLVSDEPNSSDPPPANRPNFPKTLELWKCKLCHRAKFPPDVDTRSTLNVALKNFVCGPCMDERRRQMKTPTSEPKAVKKLNPLSTEMTAEQNLFNEVRRSEGRRKKELQSVTTDIQNAIHVHMDEYIDEMLTCLCLTCKKKMKELRLPMRSSSANSSFSFRSYLCNAKKCSSVSPRCRKK